MAEKLIALQDISDTLKTGDRFEAPDRILVAMGLAALDRSSTIDADEQTPVETSEMSVPPATRRRRRGRPSS